MTTSARWLALSALWLPLASSGQTAKPAAPVYVAPRTPDGHPDLQGTYDLATLTPVERPVGTPLVMDKAMAAQLEAATSARRDQGDEAIRADRQAPPKGGDGSTGAAGNVGGYNTGWLDPGSTFTLVDGQKRASLVVDPPNGRVPAMTQAARQRTLALLDRKSVV